MTKKTEAVIEHLKQMIDHVEKNGAENLAMVLFPEQGGAIRIIHGNTPEMTKELEFMARFNARMEPLAVEKQ
jgi:hypothetical protein